MCENIDGSESLLFGFVLWLLEWELALPEYDCL